MFALTIPIALTLGACAATKLTESKTTTTKSDTTYFEKGNAIVKIPEWNLNLNATIGSRIVFVPVPGKPGLTEPCVVIKKQGHTASDQKKIGALSIQIDSLGNLVAHASQRERELSVEVLNQKRIIREKEETIQKYVQQDTGFTKFFKQLVFAALCLLVAIGLILLSIKKFLPGLI
jgi:hypothetical protein